MKNEYFIIISVLVILYIVYSVRKNKLSVKNSYSWFLLSLIMLLLSIFPTSIDKIASLVGVSYAPTLLLTLCIVGLSVIIFNYSKKIEKLSQIVIELGQELSILKSQNKK